MTEESKNSLPMAGIMSFVRWIQMNGWKEHSSKEYWYKGENWPPEQTANDKELFEMFFGKQ